MIRTAPGLKQASVKSFFSQVKPTAASPLTSTPASCEPSNTGATGLVGEVTASVSVEASSGASAPVGASAEAPDARPSVIVGADCALAPTGAASTAPARDDKVVSESVEPFRVGVFKAVFQPTHDRWVISDGSKNIGGNKTRNKCEARMHEMMKLRTLPPTTSAATAAVPVRTSSRARTPTSANCGPVAKKREGNYKAGPGRGHKKVHIDPTIAAISEAKQFKSARHFRFVSNFSDYTYTKDVRLVWSHFESCHGKDLSDPECGRLKYILYQQEMRHTTLPVGRVEACIDSACRHACWFGERPRPGTIRYFRGFGLGADLDRTKWQELEWRDQGG